MKSISHWLILLLITDLFFLFLTWLANPKLLGSIAVTIILFTVIILMAGYYADFRKHEKVVAAMQAFLSEPEENTQQKLLSITDAKWHPTIHLLYHQMKEHAALINRNQLELKSYQEFIEEWTHEIKTPISLATLVLENHKDEMSPYVYKRMGYVSHLISEDVERILYYARLQAEHADYIFTRILLDEFIHEVVSDFSAIAAERKIKIELHLLQLQVLSDRKVLHFMLSQLLNNALKYAAAEHGVVIFLMRQDNNSGKIHLAVRDNGNGVPPEDAPFIFDKGFTGNHPNRQSATGMGLYLAKKYAEALSLEIKLEPKNTLSCGFGIELIFPNVT